MAGPSVPIRKYRMTIEEIFGHRWGQAFEAEELSRVLETPDLPLGAQEIVLEMQERLRAAARGDWENARAHVSDEQRSTALDAAGASQTLTPAEWEAEQG